ncbi:MAG: biotin/lipoyl-containing protein [Pseudomonadota bacterium]
MKLLYEVDGHSVELVPVRTGESVRISIGDQEHEIALSASRGAHQTILVDGEAHRVVVAGDDECLFVHAFGRAWQVLPVDPLESVGGGAGGADHVTAPMPGTVLSVAVGEGDVVAEGDVVMVIESMKLETTIRAPIGGRVEALPLSPGATFDKGATLVRLGSSEDAAMPKNED